MDTAYASWIRRDLSADLTDDYAAIPYEMKKVANYFNQEALREVDKDDFYLKSSKDQGDT